MSLSAFSWCLCPELKRETRAKKLLEVRKGHLTKVDVAAKN